MFKVCETHYNDIKYSLFFCYSDAETTTSLLLLTVKILLDNINKIKQLTSHKALVVTHDLLTFSKNSLETMVMYTKKARHFLWMHNNNF